MGTVYEAEHVILNRRVAIKVLLPMYTEKADAVKRFILEGQAASAIDHPNIVDVHDFCREQDGTVYTVMELLRGSSLKTVLDRRGIMPIPWAVSIAMQVLSALQAAHAKGVIHRDLKPENIYLVQNGGVEQVKIVDFGIAKFKEETGSKLNLTSTGSVPGTPSYLSPEQASGGKRTDERVDIWALGVVLYEMLTGRVPFLGDNYNEVLSKILMQPLTPVRELSSDVPEELAALVEKALAKDLKDRFQSADEMYEALLPFQPRTGAAQHTTSVLSRLSASLPTDPPPGGVPQNRVQNRDAESSGMLEIADSKPSLPLRSSGTVIGVAAAVISAVIGVLLGLNIKSKDERWTMRTAAQTGETSPSPKTVGSDTLVKTDPVKEPGKSLDGIKENPPKAVTGNTEELEALESEIPSPPDKAMQETVSIDIKGLPKGARVTVDGLIQKLPLTLPRSDEPKVLKVKAKGYLSHRQTIVPSRDVALVIEMKAVKAKRNPETNDINPPEKGDKKWRSNPFADES